MPSFDEDILRIAKELWENKKTGIIDRKLLVKTAEYLREGITSGFGKAKDTTDVGMLKNLERNAYVFSGFKTYQQLKEATLLLKDDKGKIKPFDTFKNDILELSGKYNLTYLKAEYDHAIVGSQMASQWTDIQRTKDTLPWLEFDATLDMRTTSTCRALDGFVAAADDEVWDNYYLPLHWGERSVIRQRASATPSDKSKIDFPELKPMFKNNIGKTGVAFPDTHPYYSASDKDTKQIMKEVDKLHPDPNDFKTVFKHKSGGSVAIHSTHKSNEISYNTKLAKVLAKKGNEVKLLDYMEQRKNPDCSIDGKIADFKEIKTPTKGAVVNHIKSGGKQMVEIVVLDIAKSIKKHHLIEGIIASLIDKKRRKTIKQIWIIYNKTNLVKIDRKEVYDNSFIDKLL